MKSHAIQPGKLYDTMPGEPEKVYPHIELPAEIFDKEEYQPGHKCTVKLEIEIETMSKHSYGCKLLRSEELENEKKD